MAIKGALPADPQQTFTMTPAEGALVNVIVGPLATWTVGQGTNAGAASPPAPSAIDKQMQPAYALLEKINEGGMGEIWEAEQTSLARVIAVKRLKRSLANPAAEQEFYSEALVAASLEHPNILPVYDLGRDPDGSLLLAMKRIHGQSWQQLLQAEFVDPDVEAFLARHIPILVAVCQAVAYAHARGIIHRDIKPSQVLVGSFGEVLLTDWGLAVRCSDRVGATPSQSRQPWPFAPTPENASNPAGTPSLMAPEQTRTHGGELGPWTDVYLLGGSLYFLLCGRYPHSAESSAQALADASRGVVRPPSQCAGGRLVPVDLEALCMQALQADPQARPSTLQLLEGLKSYLSGSARKQRSLELAHKAEETLAVTTPDYAAFNRALAAIDEAQREWSSNPELPALRERALLGSGRLALEQDDLAYARLQCEALGSTAEAVDLRAQIWTRTRQIARRKRWLRVASAGVGLLLLTIAVGSLMFSEQLRRANDEIAERAAEAERALVIAESRSASAFDLVNFVLRDLKVAMEEELSPGRGIRFETRNQIAHAIAGKVAGPVVGYFEGAQAESWPNAMQLDYARQLLETGQQFADLARRAEARKLFDLALKVRERELGPQAVELAEVLDQLNRVYREDGEFEKAEEAIERAIGLVEARFGPEDPRTAALLIERADLYGVVRSARDRLEQAELIYEQAIAVLERHDHPALVEALTGRGRNLNYLDRPKDAEPHLRRALALYEAEHGPDDEKLPHFLDYLATSLRFQDRYDEAEALQRRALAIVDATRHPQHPERGWFLSNLASTLGSSGRTDEAIETRRAVVELYGEAYGENHFRTGREWLSLGFNLHAAGRFNDAEAALKQALANLETSLGPDYLEIGWATQFLGFSYRDTGRLIEARAALQRSIAILTERRGADHNETKKSVEALAAVEARIAAQAGGARR